MGFGRLTNDPLQRKQMSPRVSLFIVLASLQGILAGWWKNLDPSAEKLHFYNANQKHDMDEIRRWFHAVESVRGRMTHDDIALFFLRGEACGCRKPQQYDEMCYAFKGALTANKTHPHLMRAESIAVTMYTGHFYRRFNNDSLHGAWRPYLHFVSLLQSAIMKLAKSNPISPNQTLYRGIPRRFLKPKASRIFWRSFTSTSLNFNKTLGFGQETVIVFQPLASRFGARISGLSLFPHEEEVLLSPFESFDFLRHKNNTLVFTSSDTQILLK